MFKKSKTTMLTLMFLLSAIIAPGIATVNGQAPDGFGFDFDNMSNDEIEQMPQGMAQALGGVFGMMEGLGPSGAALGQVFQIMFENIWSISDQDDKIPGVYTFNATVFEEEETWEESYEQGPQGDEIYWVWDEYTQGDLGADEWAYVNISRSGSANFTYSSGASVVFIIWDQDHSLITAIQKIIDAFISVKEMIETAEETATASGWTDEMEQEIITGIVEEVLAAITYLLFHINDIINGDELIITNIITWETMNMTTTNDYGVTKEVKIWDDGDMTDDAVVPQVTVDDWLLEAEANDDEYTKWILGGDVTNEKEDKEWSRFSFNLIELWLKNFEIHINAEAIVDMLVTGASEAGYAEDSNPLANTPIYEIFQGLDIEFYFMTHSLMGFICYNDYKLGTTAADNNGVPDVGFTHINETDSQGNSVEYDIIDDSEAEYYFAIGSLGTVTAKSPTLVTDAKGNEGLQWGIRFDGLTMAAIAMNMDAKDYDYILENVEYLEMGFTFTPFENEVVEDIEDYNLLVVPETDVRMGQGIVKLDQAFGLWNGGSGPNNGNLTGLDFAVVFMSTILHFHLEITAEEMDQETYEDMQGDADAGLMNETDVYSQASGKINVGDETGDLPVAAVDIAGPEYTQKNETASNQYTATTTTIPLAFIDFDASSKVNYADYQDQTQSVEIAGIVEINASAMIYCVSYEHWNGSGDELIHDPTFTVFMEWDNPGFIAVFLAVGSLALVAIAAIMITKRKNRL